MKNTFQSFIEQGEIPNLLLSGTAGVGKTTIAKALCHELGADYYVINGSDEGRFLDTVRNQAKNFASTVSLTASSKHKVLIIDEADNTTPDVQLLLRASIEEFQKNCRFIFTCNFKNKIIEPLHSRTTVVEFNVRGQTKQELAGLSLIVAEISSNAKRSPSNLELLQKSFRNTSQTSEEPSMSSTIRKHRVYRHWHSGGAR